jgi:S1-C subfamily serine protease
MKSALLIITYLGLTCTFANADVSPLALKAAYASAVLVTLDFVKPGKVRREVSCSGFVGASEGNTEYIVTAGHCYGPEPIDKSDSEKLQVEESKTVLYPTYVTFFNGDQASVIYRKAFTSVDLCILKVHSNHKHPSVTFHEKLSRGSTVAILGYSYGYEWSLTPGLISQGDHADLSGEVPFDCPSCQPGISGGALFSNEGKVLGMVVAIDMHGSAFMVPAVDIVNALIGNIK